MNLKKISLAAVLAMSVLITGCSGGSGKSKADLQGIKEKGVLKVGVKADVPKFGYKDPSTNKIEGFEVDVAKAVAKKIFGDENKIELEPVNAKTRGPLLDNGEVDLIAATFTINDERKKTYNFSTPYFTDGVGMLVKKSSGVNSFKDLNGKKIGVSQSSTTKKAMQEKGDKEGVKMQFSEFATYPELKSALDSGRIDCFAVDGAILNGYLDDNTTLLTEKFSPQEYGVASKKSNTELAKTVDETVNELKNSGELDKLITKWGIK